MSGLEVREAEPDDLHHILVLMHHLNPDDEPLDADEAERVWREQRASGLLHVLLGWLDGEAVTSCLLAIVPHLTRGGRPFALIENVVTRTDLRGRGFGRTLMQAAVERARAADCYKVMLLTGRKDEAVFRFYESCGFDRHSKTAFELRFPPKRARQRPWGA